MNEIQSRFWKFTIFSFLLFILPISGSVSANSTETIQIAGLGDVFKKLGEKIKNVGNKLKKGQDTDQAGEVDEASSELNETTVKGSIDTPVVSEELREIQQRLHNLGYNPGPIDGMFGAKTKSAIISFFQDKGLPQNELTSEQLLSELRTQDLTEYEATVGSSSDPQIMGVDPVMKEGNLFANEKEMPDKNSLTSDQGAELELLDDFPYLLILYKYAPNTFTDAFLLERTKHQIETDQLNYRNGNPANSHVFVFSKNEVEGRVAEFAANELLPVYKKYLNNLVVSVQDQFGFSEFKQVNQLQFNHAKKQLHSEQRPERLMKLEAWQLPALKGTMWASKIPVSFSSPKLLKSRKVVLILDKDLTIPPVAMDPGVAERMWATQDDGISATVNIVIGSVIMTGNEYVINAKLVNIELENSRLKWHKTYAAENFSTVERAEDVREKEFLAEQQASQKVIEDRAKLHILGIRLGMALSEADALIRKAMPVGTVYSLERNETGSNVEGYGRARLYISEDGAQLMSLSIEKMQNSTEDEVLGVVRSVYFAYNVNAGELTSNLTKVYGEPEHKQNNFMNWGNTKQWCGSLGTKIGAIQKKNLRLIEGKEVERDLYVITWDLDPESPQEDNPYKDECSYALESNYMADERAVRQGLANHDIYYDRYAPLLPQ